MDNSITIENPLLGNSNPDLPLNDSVQPYESKLPQILSKINDSFSARYSNGSKKVIQCLYVSHALSAWSDQMWAFAVTMFFYEIWPESLTLVAEYGLIQAGATAMFGVMVGKWIDNNSRLYAVQTALILQNGAVVISGIAVIVLLLTTSSTESETSNHDYVFYVLVMLVNFLGGVAALADQAGNIAVEKDWVIVVANAAEREEPESQLATINGIMRRIDLICVLVAPIAVGLVMEYVSSLAVAGVIISWNVISGFFEYWLLYIAYHGLPDLALKNSVVHLTDEDLNAYEEWMNSTRTEVDSQKIDSTTDFIKSMENKESTDDSDSKEANHHYQISKLDAELNKDAFGDDSESDMDLLNSIEKNQLFKEFKLNTLFQTLWIETQSILVGWRIYLSQEVLLPALALAFLYFTVLNFGELMTAALRWRGVSAITLAVARGAAAVMGIIGTILYPRLEPNQGKNNTGMWAAWLQWIPLLVCLESSFFQGITSSFLLILGVVVSRLGMWMFELTVVQMMQESVDESMRGKIGGIQSALQQFALMLSYVGGLIVPNVENFWILVVLSVAMSSFAVLLYSFYFFSSWINERRRFSSLS